MARDGAARASAGRIHRHTVPDRDGPRRAQAAHRAAPAGAPRSIKLPSAPEHPWTGTRPGAGLAHLRRGAQRATGGWHALASGTTSVAEPSQERRRSASARHPWVEATPRPGRPRSDPVPASGEFCGRPPTRQPTWRPGRNSMSKAPRRANRTGRSPPETEQSLVLRRGDTLELTRDCSPAPVPGGDPPSTNWLHPARSCSTTPTPAT